MNDAQSIDALIATLPKPPEQLGQIFPIKLLKSQRARADTVLLARHGYLGMLAFASQKADRYALRIVPEQPLARACVVTCAPRTYEATTVAPSLRAVVPGVLAYHAPRYQMLTDVLRADVVHFSAAFGDTAQAEAVVSRFGPDLDRLDTMDARSFLYAACADEPWFHVLSQIWHIARQEAALWAEQVMQVHPELLIPWRISTSYHVLARDNIDVRDAAWRLVLADDVVDAAYSGRAIGQWSSWAGRPLIAIVRWLENQDIQEYTQRYPGLWQAAQAFAHDPVGYDGRLHLAFAQQVAAENPKLAYTHAANAAFYFTHATGQMPTESIIFAHELAQRQQWEHLYHVLQWVREDAHI